MAGLPHVSGASVAPQAHTGRSPLLRFALLAILGVVLCSVGWAVAGRWLAYPVAQLAAWVLPEVAPQWVRSVQVLPTAGLVVDSSVAIASAQTGGRLAEIVLEAEPARYGYGLAIFVALMAAAALVRPERRRVWRVLLGYVLLWLPQVFSLVMYLLMQLLLATGLDARLLKVSQTSVEALIYGYQLGSLVVPTLVPVLVWLALEHRFVREVLVQAWWEGQRPPAAPAMEAATAPVVQSPRRQPMAEPVAGVAAAPVSSQAAATLPERKETLKDRSN